MERAPTSDFTEATIARLRLSRPELLITTALIDGRRMGAAARIPVTDPATGLVLASVPDLGAEGARLAVDAAAAALPNWRLLGGKERSAILRRWFEAILANREDLAKLMTAEQGKPLAESRAEVSYAAAFVEWFGEEAKRVRGDTIPGPRPDVRIEVVKQPIGVVAAVTPWNFPLAMVTRKLAPALAAGCTVVLKPSELTPFSALALAVLGEEVGVPPGVVNVVTGLAPPIGEVLTGDPRIRKFTFTGSTPVGKMLAARCAGTVKRVSLELGGNAPFIVFADADLDAAVTGAVASKFRNAGQTCVCANRLLIEDAVYDAFSRRLAHRVQAMTMGDGMLPGSDVGPLIDGRAVAKAASHVADALDRGARLLTGGDDALRPASGSFFPPTVLADVTPAMLINREETFGPVAGLIRFSSEDEAVAIANDTAAGLAAYVYTRDGDRMVRVAEALEYGMVGINTGLISTELAPFGGIKESGLGREGSHYGIEEFLEIKMVCRQIAAVSQVRVR